ncbi:PEP-CTERM sorting domain-containing protein [Neptunicella sp. SCSIO 80796]|uniref:PEP-CTERM sorting domain-containing protein n=1 Tax=Neptunicella plasticusilytica TaxID=3117012 RepID=UPI003A4D77C1
MKNIIVGIGLLFTSCFANAALVTYHDYTLDDETNIVTGGGLEWLQWDVTVGMTINEALADIADGIINGITYGSGWQLATNVQMASLFNTFVLGATVPWDESETTGQQAKNYDGPTVENTGTDAELQMVALFGSTDPDNVDTRGSDDPVDFTGALFGNDMNGDGLYNSAIVMDDFAVKYAGNFHGFNYLTSDAYSADYRRSASGASAIGVAFVRTPQASTDVAEPGAITLMAIGLFGLAIRRKYTV